MQYLDLLYKAARGICLGLGGLALTLSTSVGANAQDKLQSTIFVGPAANYDSIWMADHKGYLDDENLEINFQLFPSGTTALQTFLTGQGDMVANGELPGVSHWLRADGDYRVISVIERSAVNYKVTARKEIQSPQDLAGKTVGTRVGSTGSWFISEYLAANGVDEADVEILNLDTQILPTALCQGDIDAFFIWEPFGARALEVCPDEAHFLDTAEGYINGYLVVGARPEWLASEEGRETATRFIRAVLKGRDVAEEDFDSVLEYAKAEFGLSREAIEDQWRNNGRHIGLDEVFFSDHCNLAQWMRDNDLMDQKLDFSEYVWTEGLEAIDPSLVAEIPDAC